MFPSSYALMLKLLLYSIITSVMQITIKVLLLPVNDPLKIGVIADVARNRTLDTLNTGHSIYSTYI